jgi:hypothetical protein
MVYNPVATEPNWRARSQAGTEVAFGNCLLLGCESGFLYFFRFGQNHHNSRVLQSNSACFFLINQNFSLEDELDIEKVVTKKLSDLLFVLLDSFVLSELKFNLIVSGVS